MLPDYEKMLEVFYRSFLKSGDIVVDAGAHIGRHTFPCAEAVGETGQFFCFEPLPKQFQILSELSSKSNAQSLCKSNVIPHNIALGESEGESEFVIVPDFPEYSGFKERTYHVDNLKKNI